MPTARPRSVLVFLTRGRWPHAAALVLTVAALAPAKPVPLKRWIEGPVRYLAEAAGVANLHLLCSDAGALAFPDASFDGVYERFVLEHVPDPEAALGEMCRVVNVFMRRKYS